MELSLDTFPLGWNNIEISEWNYVNWLGHIIGWLITISAVSLGAPFWFDLLGKIANLRGSGGRVKTGEVVPKN